MDYIPNLDGDLKKMIAEIQAGSYEELIAAVPRKLRSPEIDLPAPLTEMELQREIGSLAKENTSLEDTLSFLGAGAYEHFIPSAVDAISSRGEFATAYTPYQAEASQGTLQVIYEYQSMICALTGMDVSNASLYDGSSAVAEAALLARGIQKGRNRILVASTMHPDYRRNLKTYLAGLELQVVELPSRDGVLDLEELKAKADADTCALIVQSPNFYGIVEPMAEAGKIAKAAGALFVACANPISLGLLKPPGEYGADFAVGEAQPLGIPIGYGGPWLGYLACRGPLVHKISGRIVGRTVDEEGMPGFCLTLQAREQHIRREKATSNICTNQSLMALRACLYMSLVGKEGIQEVAKLNYARAHELARELSACPGFSLKYPRIFFNEFVVTTPIPAANLCREALEHGIIAGLPLSSIEPERTHELLVCVTETKSKKQLARYIEVIRNITRKSENSNPASKQK
jgi:glycine dehydrogenase subunit 1